jgi:gliding motility-associated-like protein
MTISKLLLSLFILVNATNFSQQVVMSPQPFTSTKDLFGTRNFIENKGQFENPVEKSEKILFLYEEGGEKIHFTAKGLIYELVHLDPVSEHQKEELEEKGLGDESLAERHYVQMKWENANANIEVIGEEKQGHYFTYGSADLNSYAYKQIIYKNVYPNIDVVYEIPKDHAFGIKYSLLLHPGANASDVELAYSGEIRKMTVKENGDVVIKTPLYDITEHAPKSFYKNDEPVISSFELTKQNLQFKFGQSVDSTREFVIDPWVTAVTTLSNNNYAYDVDFDFGGGTYVYGGNNASTSGRCKVSKYNSTGALVWTFSGVVTTPSWNSGTSWSSNFKVNKGLGKTYVSRNNGSPNLIRLDASGNYDNFISFGSTAVGEVWAMDLICNGDLLVFGGANTSGEIVSTATGSITLVTTFSPGITGCCQDVVSYAIDPVGDMFVYFLGHTQLNYKIGKLSQTFTTSLWHQPSGFSVFAYLQNKSLYPGANAGNAIAFNALAVNMNYLFYYDGYNVAAYNKSTGSLVSSTVVTGQTGREQGGIAVDDCNNVYVGGNGNIMCFSFNGTNFSTLTPIPLNASTTIQYVADVSLNVFSNTLYVSGSGFVGMYAAIHSTTCALQQVTSPCNFGQGTITAQTTSITCANLGSASVTAVGGLGPFTFSWVPSGQTGSVISNVSPGNYSVIVTDVGANFTYTAMAIFTPLIPLSGYVLSSGSVPCYGAATATAGVFNLSGGSGNQNYLWTNGISTQTTAIATGLGAGNWSVTVTDALTGCQINPNFSIFQPTQLGSFVSAPSPTACVGDTITMNAIVSGGIPSYTCSWTNGTQSCTALASETLASVYSYTVNSVDQNLCPISSPITVTFVPYPVLSVADVSICPLKTGTLVALGATSYTWNNTTTGSAFTDSPIAKTVYTVTGTSAGCASSATAQIVVMPVPSPGIVLNSPLCQTTNLQLIGTGGVSYVWTGPQSFTSAAAAPTIGAIALNQAGVYQMTVTAANTCTASTTATVDVNPIPFVSAIGSTVCTVQTMSLGANAVPASTFNWSGPNQFSSFAQNPILNLPSLTANGFYTVVATTANGCTANAVAQVSVVAPPTLSITLSSNTLCAQALNGSPNSVTLTALGAVSYTLITPSQLTIQNAGNPYQLASSAPFSTILSLQTVTLVGSNGVCSSIKNSSVNIVPNPVISIVSSTPAICAGVTFTYTNYGASAYTWTNTNNALMLNSNGSIAIATPSVSSVFSAFGSSAGCNSGIVSTNINVYNIPTLSLSPKQSTICIGTATVIKASGTAVSYNWSPPYGLNSANSASVTARPFANQIYTVVGTANGCTTTATTGVYLLALPQPTALAEKNAVCLNELIVLHGTGGENYWWKGPNHFALGGQTVSFTAINLGLTGEYRLIVSDKKGCIDSTSIRIAVNPLPEGTLYALKTEGCVPFCPTFTFQASPQSAATTATWIVENQKFTQVNFIKCFEIAGEYELKGLLQDSTTHCQNTHSFAVRAYDVPIANFDWIPKDPIESLDEVKFTNKSEGENIVQFTWYFMDLPIQGTSVKEHPSYIYKDAGKYPVAFTIKNNHGCSDTAVKMIQVLEDFSVYIPNSFTPNNDGKNDEFSPVLRGVRLFEISVYDRWGNKVYSNSDPAQTWKGEYKDQACKEVFTRISFRLPVYTAKQSDMMGISLCTVKYENKKID